MNVGGPHQQATVWNPIGHLNIQFILIHCFPSSVARRLQQVLAGGPMLVVGISRTVIVLASRFGDERSGLGEFT